MIVKAIVLMCVFVVCYGMNIKKTDERDVQARNVAHQYLVSALRMVRANINLNELRQAASFFNARVCYYGNTLQAAQPRLYASFHWNIAHNVFDQVVARVTQLLNLSSGEAAKVREGLLLGKYLPVNDASVREFLFLHGYGKSIFARMITVNRGGRIDIALAYFDATFMVLQVKPAEAIGKRCRIVGSFKPTADQKIWLVSPRTGRRTSHKLHKITLQEQEWLKGYFRALAIQDFLRRYGSLIPKQVAEEIGDEKWMDLIREEDVNSLPATDYDKGLVPTQKI